MLVLTRKDKYNFQLGELLDNPITKKVNFGGKEVEVTQTHKQKELFYGRLYNAITGWNKHNGYPIKNIEDLLDKKLHHIKPEDDENSYSGLMNVEITPELLKQFR